jgi:hypothetical protein
MPPSAHFSLHEKLVVVYSADEETGLCVEFAGAIAKLPQCVGIVLSLWEDSDETDPAFRFVEENQLENKVLRVRANSEMVARCVRKFPNLEFVAFWNEPRFEVLAECVGTCRKLTTLMGCGRGNIEGVIRTAHTNENITTILVNGFVDKQPGFLNVFFRENPYLADRPWFINGGRLNDEPGLRRRGVVGQGMNMPVHWSEWWCEPRYKWVSTEAATREGEKRRSLFAFVAARFAEKTPTARFLEADGDCAALRRVAYFLN